MAGTVCGHRCRNDSGPLPCLAVPAACSDRGRRDCRRVRITERRRDLDAKNRQASHAVAPIHRLAKTTELYCRTIRHLRLRPRCSGSRSPARTDDVRDAMLGRPSAPRPMPFDRGDGVRRGGALSLRRADQTAADRPAGTLSRLAHSTTKRLPRRVAPGAEASNFTQAARTLAGQLPSRLPNGDGRHACRTHALPRRWSGCRR